MDVAESGVAPELEQQKPPCQKGEKDALIWQFFPKIDTEFLKNPVIAGCIGRLRVYSTLFDSELVPFAQSNSTRGIRTQAREIRRRLELQRYRVAHAGGTSAIQGPVEM
jgi:hypothetical protein